MKRLCIFNRKGGVGKSTTAVNLSVGLTLMDKRVLLIDLDSQGDATRNVGIKNGDIKYGISEVVLGHISIEKAIVKTSTPNLDIISNNDVIGEFELDITSDNRMELRNIIKNSSLKENYDYIIFDCPPGVSELMYNGLIASEGVIATVSTTPNSINALMPLFKFIEAIQLKYNPEIHIAGILPTLFRKVKRDHNELLEALREGFSDLVFDTYIPDNVHLESATGEKKHIFDYKKSSVGARAYYRFAKEINDKYYPKR